MNAAERAEKLNAYLISKGRQPRPSGTVNFIKQNIGTARRKRPSSALTGTTNMSTEKKYGSCEGHTDSVRTGTSQKQRTVASGVCVAMVSLSNRSQNPLQQGLLRTPKHQNNNALRKGTAKTPSACSIASSNTPKGKTSVERSPYNIRKKLVCRSIKIMNHKGVRSTTKTPGRTTGAVSRITKATPQKDGERTRLYDRLNNWLIAKGKKPIDGQKIRGFKPAKTIATPINSPVQTPKTVQTGGSHWQGLRDEDDSDELSILIQNTMIDVQSCMNEGCHSEIICKTLEELAEKLPRVESHAIYWVTRAQLEQMNGKSDQEICDLYEQAILSNAKPIEDIKKAINGLAMQKIEKPESTIVQSEARSPTASENQYQDLSPKHYFAVPTNQNETLNPAIARFLRFETPVLKNAATSPITFDSPKHARDVQVMPNSPSSVVKLRMVSKLSPVFQRLKSLRMIPEDASAIVTPVRRSKRISAAQQSYPQGLLDHEPCLSTVHEIFPALDHRDMEDENANLTCHIVYDPNAALGNHIANIATVLKF